MGRVTNHGVAFRAAILMSQALAVLASQFAPGTVAFSQAAERIGPYKGRGKGRARYHDQGGTRAFQRAAAKARNVKRHKAHCKGKR